MCVCVRACAHARVCVCVAEVMVHLCQGTEHLVHIRLGRLWLVLVGLGCARLGDVLLCLFSLGCFRLCFVWLG